MGGYNNQHSYGILRSALGQQQIAQGSSASPGSIFWLTAQNTFAFQQAFDNGQQVISGPCEPPKFKKIGGRAIDRLREELSEWHGKPFA